MTIRGLIATVLLAVGSLAFAAPPTGVHVQQAWIRWLPANLPMAGYATIVNDSNATVRLTDSSSPTFATVMLHHSRLAHGDSSMDMVSSLDIPAHGNVTLAPGGYHLMLSQAKRPVEPGDTVTVVLKFADGTRLPVDFAVLPANSTGPAD